jgi:hypothetical protein
VRRSEGVFFDPKNTRNSLSETLVGDKLKFEDCTGQRSERSRKRRIRNEKMGAVWVNGKLADSDHWKFSD